jgi:hypothetical protein
MPRGCLRRCVAWPMAVRAILQVDRMQRALHGNLGIHVVWVATSRDARIRWLRKSR